MRKSVLVNHKTVVSPSSERTGKAQRYIHNHKLASKLKLPEEFKDNSNRIQKEEFFTNVYTQLSEGKAAPQERVMIA